MKTVNKDSKTFAFKLASKSQVAKTDTKWKARDGIALAGCTGPDGRGPHFRGRDAGILC